MTCGHPPPLRLTADGGLRALTPRAYATPLGLHPDIQPSTFTVSAGDRLVFYTDGLLEARDRAGRYFRLEDCAGTLRQPDLQAAADGLLDRVLAHTKRKLDDDVALLLVEAAPVRSGAGRPADARPDTSSDRRRRHSRSSLTAGRAPPGLGAIGAQPGGAEPPNPPPGNPPPPRNPPHAWMALRNFDEFAPLNPPLGRLPGWKLPDVGRAVGGWPDPDPPKFGRDTPCFCRHCAERGAAGAAA